MQKFGIQRFQEANVVMCYAGSGCSFNLFDGFGCVVVLPKGTNLPLEGQHKDRMLAAKNKWLIAHSECKKQVDLGRVIGITGKNINIDE